MSEASMSTASLRERLETNPDVRNCTHKICGWFLDHNSPVRSHDGRAVHSIMLAAYVWHDEVAASDGGRHDGR